ncbi:TPA: hypothetical protein N0F65_006659 [Lagenidium giganteum]|uniref:Protein kinase domain-containing protein n=1 Tax=Lagenidium giganteum TaxID=4803 RepID=A0AAV2YG48_9STRA|nr:TPA: hypothetical protein N0F65_006659 [Lagenidium giganteum]
MDGISMNDHAPTLTIPSTLNSLSIKGSQLVDLKLQMSTQGPNASAKLKTLELTNNDFTTIPTCLQTGTVKNLTVLQYVSGAWSLCCGDARSPRYCSSLNVPKQVNLGAEEFSRFSTNYHDALPTKVNANDGVLSQEQVDKDCSATGVLVCMSGSTASAPTNKGSSGSSISAGAIVGIALGAVAVIAIIAFMLLRRRRSNSPDKGPQSSYLSCPTPAYSPRRSAARGGHEVAGASDLPVLLYEEISIAEPQGAKHLCGAKFQGEKVLLKRLKADITDAHVARQLQAQARLLLANQHPNIVQIRGVTMVNGMDFSVVAEFMDKGSLRMALKDAKIILSVRDRISLCADIAEALQFLHDPSRKMYVRRLTSQKVLVNSQLTCKINLFECHPIASDARNVNAYGTGELAWTAPELIMGDDKVDVRMCNMFALGVIICETITGAAPYASEVESLGSTLADFEIKKRVKRHEHLTPHEHSAAFHDAPIQLQKLVESCLAINPRDRPTAARAAAVLKEVLQDMPRGSETF